MKKKQKTKQQQNKYEKWIKWRTGLAATSREAVNASAAVGTDAATSIQAGFSANTYFPTDI